MNKLKKALDKAREKHAFDTGEENTTALIHYGKTGNEDSRAVNPLYTQTKTMHAELQSLERHKVIFAHGGSDNTDRMKIFRTRLLNAMKENNKNSLLITSPRHGEGKTLTAINLAIALAQQLDSTVLLVDTDLRKPSVHEFFGLQTEKGLSSYLTEDEALSNLMINPGIPRLVILPGGKPLTNSAELMDTQKMESLIEELKERYNDRFIIFDSSPILTNADPIILARSVDAVLLVVEAEKTTREDIKRSLEQLEGTTIIGTVLNKSRE